MSCRLASTRVPSQPRLKEIVTLSGFDRTRQSVFHDKSPSLISTNSRSSYARSIDRKIRSVSSIDSETDIVKSSPTDINFTSDSGTDTRKYTPCVKLICLKVERYDDLRDRASETSFRKNRIRVRRKIWIFRKIMRCPSSKLARVAWHDGSNLIAICKITPQADLISASGRARNCRPFASTQRTSTRGIRPFKHPQHAKTVAHGRRITRSRDDPATATNAALACSSG